MSYRAYAEHEGDFHRWEPANRACGRCGSALAVRCRRWDSHDGGYEDWQYQCIACGRRWWVEGIDS